MQVGILTAFFVSTGFGLAATAVEPIEIASRRELFVNRHLVGELKGSAKLYLHKPQPGEVALLCSELRTLTGDATRTAPS